MDENGSGRRRGPVARRNVFWLGVQLGAVGVVLHLPMYVASAGHGYRMAHMSPDAAMVAGMVLVVAGLALGCFGLVPRDLEAASAASARLRVSTLDDAPLRASHLGLTALLSLAITVDVMKPTTLAFIMPGVSAEYGLRSAANPHGSVPSALLPLAGLVGIVLGSMIWGTLGDRLGRRAAMLIAALIFVDTSICGAMPGFGYNLLMCVIMGLGVGGMLPLTFALLSETVPARHRGWLIVLVGGDVAGAYAITSWLAGALIPHYSWRIMWLIGLPTGLLLILLSRFIPESPRFLLANGRPDEAAAVMRRYGAEVVAIREPHASPGEPQASPGVPATGGYRELIQPRLLGRTMVVVWMGLGVGLVSFGFQLWAPTNLQQLGFPEVTATEILRNSALLGLPLNLLVAWLYGRWSSRGTILLLTVTLCLSLLGFAVFGAALAGHRWLLSLLLIGPTWCVSSVIATLTAYGSEVFPTPVRGRGTGLASAATRFGGVAVTLAVAAAWASPSLTALAVIGLVPLTIAAYLTWRFGLETAQRTLEHVAQPGSELEAAA